jgi:excisionase family DNA binding protein
MNLKLAYTVEEAAKLLSISRSRLYELIHAGEIQSIKFGRSRRITAEQLRQFLKQSEVGPHQPVLQ